METAAYGGVVATALFLSAAQKRASLPFMPGLLGQQDHAYIAIYLKYYMTLARSTIGLFAVASDHNPARVNLVVPVFASKVRDAYALIWC